MEQALPSIGRLITDSNPLLHLYHLQSEPLTHHGLDQPSRNPAHPLVANSLLRLEIGVCLGHFSLAFGRPVRGV